MISGSMEETLNAVLAGVTQAVEQAKREGSASRAEADHWRLEYECQRARVEQLEAELAACRAKIDAATSLQVGGGSGRLPNPSLPPRSEMLGRRNTISLGHFLNCSCTCGASSSRSLLRLSLDYAQAQAAEMLAKQAPGQGEQDAPQRQRPQRQSSLDSSNGSTLTLSRLSRMLGACLLMESAAGGAGGDGSGVSSTTGGHLQHVDSSCSLLEGQTAVSLTDDGGGAGVGATAAAAVSVALAKSWAVAAGAGHAYNMPRLARQAANSGGGGTREPAGSSSGGGGGAAAGESGRGGERQPAARFKLMAAVPRNQARRTNLRTSESRVSLSPEPPANGSAGGDTPTVTPRAAGNGAGALTHRGSTIFASESAMALDNLLPSSPRGGLDDAQEATWRACGSHLKLQWLSAPSTVLVVYKPAPAVLQSALCALAWLLRRGLRVYVEPSVHAELVQLLEANTERERLEQRDSGLGGGVGMGGDTAHGAAAAGAAAVARGHAAAANGHYSSSSGAGGAGFPSPHARVSPSSPIACSRPPRMPHGGGSSGGGGLYGSGLTGSLLGSAGSGILGASLLGAAHSGAFGGTGTFGSGHGVSFSTHTSYGAALHGSMPSGAPGSSALHGNGTVHGGCSLHDSGGIESVPALSVSAAAAAPVDLAAQLRTWDPSDCCDNAIPSWVADQLDLVITLGGDGTVLWTCSMFASGAVPPIVPFAMGSLGFMTPFPIERMEAVLRRTTTPEHGFPLMLRHRLQCRILRAGTGSATDLQSQAVGGPPALACGDEMVVLNEVVIDRGATACLTNLQVYVDQNFVTAIQGDGLIVATPTGSTAYSLAAGGSMVHPGVPALLFTPICPHTISSRPLVFPEHVVLRVKVPQDSRAEAYCSFDGRARQALYPGDSVLIRMSPWPVPMVCSLDASHDWFLSVREGLNWNLRKQQAGRGA